MQPTGLTPVNVITGFLGSGKTTLPNHLVAEGVAESFQYVQSPQEL